MNDEMAWVIQAQNGNDEAFTHLVETYQKPVYNLCYRMLGDPDAAEDAAQESFLRAYQNLARYDRNRSFATWLLSIAAHYCIDRLRRRKFVAFSMDQTDDEDDAPIELPDAGALDPEAEAERREDQRTMHGLLKSIDATDRAALIMRYWHDCSEIEIAQALNLTVSAVKSRLHRARKELGKHWQAAEPKHKERMAYESPAF